MPDQVFLSKKQFGAKVILMSLFLFEENIKKNNNKIYLYLSIRAKHVIKPNESEVGSDMLLVSEVLFRSKIQNNM